MGVIISGLEDVDAIYSSHSVCVCKASLNMSQLCVKQGDRHESKMYSCQEESVLFLKNPQRSLGESYANPVRCIPLPFPCQLKYLLYRIFTNLPRFQSLSIYATVGVPDAPSMIWQMRVITDNKQMTKPQGKQNDNPIFPSED